MKLTWFGGTTIRIHVGGAILVADPRSAPADVDRGELVSGADQAFALAPDDTSLPSVDPATWRQRKPGRAIDETATPPILLHRIGLGAVLVDAAGEPPLALISGGAPRGMGRWAGEAVVVLFGTAEPITSVASALLESSPPRLIVLATSEDGVDGAIAALSARLGGASLVSLEPGLAVEV